MSKELTPEDHLRHLLEDYMATELFRVVHTHGRALNIEFADDYDDDDGFPILVESGDGRTFEIEFELIVTELTEKLLTHRSEQAKLLRQLLSKTPSDATPNAD